MQLTQKPINGVGVRQRVFKVTLTNANTPYALKNQAALVSVTPSGSANTAVVVVSGELRVVVGDNVLLSVADWALGVTIAAKLTAITGMESGVFIAPVTAVASGTTFTIGIPGIKGATAPAIGGSDYANAGQMCRRARLLADAGNTTKIQLGPDSNADSPAYLPPPSGGYSSEYVIVDLPFNSLQGRPVMCDLSAIYVQSTVTAQVVWVWMEYEV